MRFNFSFTVNGDEEPSTPSVEPVWIPLQKHPVFTVASSTYDHTQSAFGVRRDLLAWDGGSRLYFWNSKNVCLHRITIRLGDPSPTAVMAASSSKVLEADVPLNSVIDRISVNRNGSSLLLSASSVVHVLYLYGRPSTKDNNTLICRVVSVGPSIYFESNNALRILQVSWHPCSDTHLGILSSDSIFRLFDLSSDFDHPEQEYYLQPVERGRHRNASSLCPVDFSFGSDHMWDRFSLFVLFSDGSIYILCPVVPFGSVYRLQHLLEIYNDAKNFGLNSVNSAALYNSSLALSWLEATFPDLPKETTQEKTPYVVKAFPYVFSNATLLLQGPLRYVCNGEPEGEIGISKCDGRAVSFLFNPIKKDSILVTSWSGGHLKIDALTDEIQPAWKVGSNSPRLCVDSCDRISSFAMICESNPDPNPNELANATLNQPLDQTAWLGKSPPLLRLAIVDLALPKNMKLESCISIYVDPLIPKRIYSSHGGGIDSIILHSLPFTSLAKGEKQCIRSPSVNPVLSTYQGDFSSPSPLCGFVALSDSFGNSWIVGITSSGECAVHEMKTWNTLLPIVEREPIISAEVPLDMDTASVISKGLLSGPKMAIIPSASPSLQSLGADSIEGRSTLHQYFKLFHEIYVEYAHKVYFELKHREFELKRIVDDQYGRVKQSREKLLQVEQKQVELQDRLHHAIKRHSFLNQRLQCLRNLPGAHRSPLSKAERHFKSELDRFKGVELDALRTSIEALNGRLKRCAKSVERGDSQNLSRMKKSGEEAQISQLKSSISKLSLMNSENSKKVKIVESELRRRESSC